VTDKTANMTGKAALCAVLILAPLFASGQESAADAARAERLAAIFEDRSRVLTLFDRNGTLLTTVGERGMYGGPVLSPDGKRIAVTRSDFINEIVDIWVIDIESGDETRITRHGSWDKEWPAAPLWSPDGSQLAYVGLRQGYEGVYLKSADGEGAEELLYQHAGAEVWLGDWSTDGRYISLSTSYLSGGFLYVLPMTGTGERAAIELLHSDSQLLAGSFSPDSRLLSYMSDQSGIKEVYVRTVDPEVGSADESTAGNWQVSDRGGAFAIRAAWTPGSDELYYLAADQSIVAANVDALSSTGAVARTTLFRLSQAVRVTAGQINVSRDGKRVVIAVPPEPKLEQVTVFDREGTVLQRLGDPGVFRNVTLSPDGKRVAVLTRMAETGNIDIWTFDLSSGVGTPITDDETGDNWPVWSPDGNELAYASERGMNTRIHRKASDGTGNEEAVFEYEPGAFLQVTDWSADGRYLTFHDGCWGVLYVVPLDGEQDWRERKAMEWLRDEFQVAQARFSPDSRYIAYLTDEIVPEVFQINVAPFDATQPDGRVEDATPVQVSADRVLGMVSWRGDGREMYYLTKDWEVMAIDVTTTPVFEAGTPKLLFKLPGPLPGEPKQWKSVTPDGKRFVFVVYVPASITEPQ
jgi:Tol biopolymer transport system component